MTTSRGMRANQMEDYTPTLKEVQTMNDPAMTQAIFFDIGDTLGTAVISRHPLRLDRLIVFPYVTPILERLRNRDMRLGIISNTIPGDTADDMKVILDDAGIFIFFEPDLLIYSSVIGLSKNSPVIFELAACRARHSATPEECFFVGEDPQERYYAGRAGFQVSSHPELIEDMLSQTCP